MKKLTGKSIAVLLLILLNFFYIGFVSAQTETGVVVADSDYRATKVLGDLPASRFFTFDFEGNYIFDQVAGSEKIVKITPSGESSILVDRVSQPLIGLSFNKGKVYAVFRGRIDVVSRGSFSDIVTGLPAGGDYANSSVIFNDGKMYFSVGTATNSGIVGPDNVWIKSQPSIHDLSCASIKINEVSVEVDNFLTAKKGDKAVIGSFMPFNTKNYSDTVPGSYKCNGAVFRANPDGSNLEVVAWGFHNLKGISFDAEGNLYGLDSGMEGRGLRPIKDGKDSLFLITKGSWYGWPDFNAGKQVEQPLIKVYPNTPERPMAVFDPSTLSQFTVNQSKVNSGLAIAGNNKVVEFSLNSDHVNDFLTVPEGARIEQIKNGPDNNLYVLITDKKKSELWRVENTKHSIPAVGSVGSRTLPVAWSISLSITAVGLIAAYLVYKNRQEPTV